MVEKCVGTAKKSDHFDLTRAGEVHQSFWNGGGTFLGVYCTMLAGQDINLGAVQ